MRSCIPTNTNSIIFPSLRCITKCNCTRTSCISIYTKSNRTISCAVALVEKATVSFDNARVFVPKAKALFATLSLSATVMSPNSPILLASTLKLPECALVPIAKALSPLVFALVPIENESLPAAKVLLLPS